MAAETAPNNPATPNIYAELLPRLGRISVVIHLPSPSNHKTKVLVSNDASRLILYHEDVTTELRLPAKAIAPVGEHLRGEVQPGLDKMSWRLIPDPVDVKSGMSADDAVPWSAGQLKPGLRITCRACDHVVVAEDSIKVFKDLPSENWAEMMELWHCHKPAVGHAVVNGSNGVSATGGGGQEKATETDLASRGYGANSAIVAQKGTGFVDLMTMLFFEDDCRCLMVSYHSRSYYSLHPSWRLPNRVQFSVLSCPIHPCILITVGQKRRFQAGFGPFCGMNTVTLAREQIYMARSLSVSCRRASRLSFRRSGLFVPRQRVRPTLLFTGSVRSRGRNRVQTELHLSISVHLQATLMISC